VTQEWAGLTPPYGTIVADPPWMYQKDPGSKSGSVMASMAEGNYSTMTNEEIAALPVADLAADQAHLYLWVTNPGMFGGRFSRVTPRDIVEAWGFRYVTLITWVKPGAGGMGWYFRGQTEHIVFATRGDLGIPAEKRRPNVINAARSGHSRKPVHALDLIESVSPGPYVELFSRDPQMGWDSWGHGYEVSA
jgi:N6-adenosine-specific RNA methylase IME4